MKTGHLVVLVTLAALAALFSLPSRPALGASYVVDTTADDPGIALQCGGGPGDCSLRGAITAANVNPAGDVITFDPAVTAIPIASVLPSLSGGGDTIDGSGATVIIDSTDEGRGFNCLNVPSAGNTIKGLQFTDCASAILINDVVSDNNIIGPGNTFFDNGTGINVSIAGATGNSVIGNKIGTNAAGTAVHPDGGNSTGINIFGASNTVGGASPSDRNIISGNSGSGVVINGASATGNVLKGNFIGTDAAGTVDLGNSHGVFVTNSAFDNTIGGTAPGEANLISGNTVTNVNLNNSASINTVAGNIIGPDINGSGAAMASGIGVLIAAGANTVGPLNVISDNADGVWILLAGTQGNVVKGNLIGTDLSGSAGVPNSGRGVNIDNSAGPNTVGGTSPGDGNVIAFNAGGGVRVDGTTPPAAVGNAIRGNSIHSNGGLEIANVSGGNLELARPAVTAAGSNAVGGIACANCEVDIFSDGASEAEFYEGSVTADAAGEFALYTSISGPNVTATNTDTAGNTSELSVASPFTSDADADGVPDPLDNCPDAANPGQENADATLNAAGATHFGLPLPADALGDACDEDDDNDGFSDTVETNIGTNPLDNCVGLPGSGGDGWPLDNNLTSIANITDVNAYKGIIPNPVDETHPKRLDLNDSGILNINDVFFYKGIIPTFCT